jgi:ceramide glucosyltransferase
VAYIFLALALAALTYQILALMCLVRFFHTPLPSGAASGPGVTVFKPLKGREPFTRECLASFLAQDYRPYQVIFGVSDRRDPVLPLLQELKEAFPGVEVDIHLCSEARGLNPKVSNLRQMEPRARYDLLVIADADVKVGPDFLSRVVAALQDPEVGLVNCPYRAGRSLTLGAKLEALTIAADFMPAVATAFYLEGIRFALGATMALSRQTLTRIGGLAPLADFLADDYQLGRRVADLGLKVRLLPYVVETLSPKMAFSAYAAHQLRWARTVRVCRPRSYLAYGITHALMYSTAFLLASGATPLALALIAAALALRGGLAWSAATILRADISPGAFLLLPLKDAFSFALWLLSFLGNRVTWGNQTYRVTHDGKLARE